MRGTDAEIDWKTNGEKQETFHSDKKTPSVQRFAIREMPVPVFFQPKGNSCANIFSWEETDKINKKNARFRRSLIPRQQYKSVSFVDVLLCRTAYPKRVNDTISDKGMICFENVFFYHFSKFVYCEKFFLTGFYSKIHLRSPIWRVLFFSAQSLPWQQLWTIIQVHGNAEFYFFRFGWISHVVDLSVTKNSFNLVACVFTFLMKVIVSEGKRHRVLFFSYQQFIPLFMLWRNFDFDKSDKTRKWQTLLSVHKYIWIKYTHIRWDMTLVWMIM